MEKKEKNNIKCYTENIFLSRFEDFPSQIQSYSNNVENSIYSMLKLYSPLREIQNDKYFGIKKNHPHHLFFTKVYAFTFILHYNDIDLSNYKPKIFPQTNLNIIFKSQKFNINTNGFLSIKNRAKNTYIETLSYDEKRNIYKVSINKNEYIIIIIIDNNIEVDGILKAIESFDLSETLKTKILYINYNNNKINFIGKDSTNYKFIINKNSKIIIDIKSSFSIEDSINQIEFHESIIYNLLDTCCEDVKNYYYFLILSDKNKTKSKEKQLNDFLQNANLNLNVIILLAENSSIFNKNFELVIDKEYLTADIYSELKKINNNIEIFQKQQSKFEERLTKVEKDIDDIKKEMLTKEILKKSNDDIKKTMEEMLNKYTEELIQIMNGKKGEENSNNSKYSLNLFSSIKKWLGYD